MLEFAPVFSPFFALGLNIAFQILSVRRLGPKALFRSIGVGFLSGLTFLIIVNAMIWTQTGGISYDRMFFSLSSFLIYGAFSNIFFHFINMGETARRIRLLRELYDAPKGLSLDEILRRYNAREIVSLRLNRLSGKGQIKEENGRYYVRGKAMVVLARMMLLMRLFLLGKKQRDRQSAKL